MVNCTSSLNEFLKTESSNVFSSVLFKFVSEIVKADYEKKFKECVLPSEIKKAIILYQGKLTPDYQYIDKYL